MKRLVQLRVLPLYVGKGLLLSLERKLLARRSPIIEGFAKQKVEIITPLSITPINTFSLASSDEVRGITVDSFWN